MEGLGACVVGIVFHVEESDSDVRCTKPITLRTGTFNCGQCHACRINYTSGWTLRLLYELTSWKDASFITLTYDNDHLPIDGGLHLSHVQKFFDTLRHKIDWLIKYYHCGEYGERRKRPHYHIILFGLDPFNPEHRKIVYESWARCEPIFFDPLPKDWQKSKSCEGKGMLPVCREDIAYVCGYVQKKLTGELGKKEYANKKPPYCTCSHGIGLENTLKQADRLRHNKWTYLNGKRVGLPRYMRDKLGIIMDFEGEQKLLRDSIRENWLEVFEMFKEKYPNIDPMSKSFEKLFNNWYERREWDYTVQIMRDFLDKKHLRYGLE